jgi:hypothetical protein
MSAVLALTAGPILLPRPALADDPKPGQAAGAKPVRLTVAMLTGGTDGDLKVLRETLAKIPDVKFKADDLKYADFGRDGGLFTGFLVIELADLAKTDVGAVAKAVAAADTPKKEKVPSGLFAILRYKPDSVKTDDLRKTLARVKGVRADKSWAGDSNLWVAVDGSGQAKLAEITAALHAAGVKFRDPVTDAGE